MLEVLEDRLTGALEGIPELSEFPVAVPALQHARLAWIDLHRGQ